MNGIELIAQERQRQIEYEGWDAEHDRQHTEGELSLVAALYATPVKLYARRDNGGDIEFYDPWPWWDTRELTRYNDGSTYEVKAWDKRTKHSRKKRLIIAGALIAAELDRLQRLEVCTHHRILDSYSLGVCKKLGIKEDNRYGTTD